MQNRESPDFRSPEVGRYENHTDTYVHPFMLADVKFHTYRLKSVDLFSVFPSSNPLPCL